MHAIVLTNKCGIIYVRMNRILLASLNIFLIRFKDIRRLILKWKRKDDRYGWKNWRGFHQGFHFNLYLIHVQQYIKSSDWITLTDQGGAPLETIDIDSTTIFLYSDWNQQFVTLRGAFVSHPYKNSQGGATRKYSFLYLTIRQQAPIVYAQIVSEAQIVNEAQMVTIVHRQRVRIV